MPQEIKKQASAQNQKEADDILSLLAKNNFTFEDLLNALGKLDASRATATADSSAVSEDTIGRYTKAFANAVYKVILSRIPVYGEVQIFSQEFALILAEEIRTKLEDDRARWEKNLDGMTREQIVAQKTILEFQKQSQIEELEKYRNFDGAWGVIVRDVLEVTHQETILRIEGIKTRLDILKGVAIATEKLNSETQKITRKVEAGKEDQANGAQKQQTLLDRSSNPKKLPTTTPQSVLGGVEIGKPVLSKVPTAPPEQAKKQVKETFIELAALNESFHNSFNAGMQAIGQSINQSVGGMFRNVFGEANSLLEIFIANFVSSMASDVISLLTGGATGGILSILGFAKGGIINEPIFGIGKSGQRYLFGEAGREAVIPFSEMAASVQATRMNGMSAMIKPTVVVTPLISSKGLAVQVEIGNRMNARSRT